MERSDDALNAWAADVRPYGERRAARARRGAIRRPDALAFVSSRACLKYQSWFFHSLSHRLARRWKDVLQWRVA
jgi:hypothetical protein